MNKIECIKRDFKQAINKLYGDRLSQIILYGSYARGDNNQNSDIDFLVVLNEEEIALGKELYFMNSAIFRLTLHYGIMISHYPTTRKKLENSQSMFYSQIRKEGKVI
ncbi:nucleotidyltransferase family protein [Thermoflexibacter ruber]|uniref:Nucleotidyltransferase domain-containing protein n=1 Tax=Thermoflexibacter ruber TaxID=1003 RepID=A0A1I2HEM3_9BACT|nr:nucleotidyltransferase domain-containing protein [Thermoflexibacter ruber]SFF27367.1 Nucleotidyltransferase domain-containing protein [Thermoflexibacter ruber]